MCGEVRLGSKSQVLYSEEASEQTCEQVSEPTRSGAGRSNSDLLARMPTGGAVEAPVDLGQVDSGPTFAKAGGRALDAMLPGLGSFASARLGVKLLIWSSGAARAYFDLMSALQATRTAGGQFEVMMSLQIGLRAEAGLDRASWWPAFLAYVKGYGKGSLKIVANSAQEVFDELLLILAELVELALGATNSDLVDATAARDALLDGKYQSLAQGVGKGESMTASLGGGAEGGTKVGDSEISLGGEVMLSRTYTNEDGDDDLELTPTSSRTISGQLVAPKLGLTVPAGITWVWKHGELDELFFSFGVAKKMSLETVSRETLAGAAWAQGLANATANLVATTGEKAGLDKTALADLPAGIDPSAEALRYTALGTQLKSVATSPAFAGKLGQEVSIAIDGQFGWSEAKGVNLRLALSTAETWSLGEEGKTPLFIEARSGDTLVSVENATHAGTSVGT